jgi:site-specific recombinase XerD
VADLIADFCQWQRAYNGVSEERVRNQQRLLLGLQAHAGELTAVTPQQLEQFLLLCEVAPATTAKHLKMIRPFFKWLYRNKHITAERLMEIHDVRAPRGAGWGEPKPYTRAEIARFWRKLDDAYPWTSESDPLDRTPKRAEYWVRHWQESRDPYFFRHTIPYARRLQVEAVIALSLFGGLRRVEIFNLALEDMHYENAYVRVVGAAKNPAAEAVVRAVPMVSNLKTALANWIEFRAQVLQPEHDRPWLTLWHGREMEPITFSVFGHLLNRVGDGYELHRMRHTFATERLRAGMPVETVQKILGHSNVAMTLRYSRIGIEDVLRVADKTNDDFVGALAREEGDERDGTDAGRHEATQVGAEAHPDA